MPRNTTGLTAPAPSSYSEFSDMSLGQTDLAAAASMSSVLANAAAAQGACQQIELALVGQLSMKIASAASS